MLYHWGTETLKLKLTVEAQFAIIRAIATKTEGHREQLHTHCLLSYARGQQDRGTAGRKNGGEEMKSSERAMKEQAMGHRERIEKADEMSKGKHFAWGQIFLGIIH